MMHASDMIASTPKDLGGIDSQVLARRIEACSDCALTCSACADACLSEEMVAELVTCIRADLDCADVCGTTGRVLSRYTAGHADLTRSVLETCATACKACGDECSAHADMHEHCRICADACRRCEKACRDLLAAMP